MAHHFAFLGSLLVLFLCFSSSSAARSIGQGTDEVCQRHNDPSFCHTILNDKGGMELPMQVQMAIAMALVNASDTRDKLDTLVEESINDVMKEHYRKCVPEYDDAFLSLTEASKRMVKRQFDKVTEAATSVMTSLENCEKTIPAGGGSLVKNDIEYLQGVTEIIEIAPVVMMAKGEEQGPPDAPEEAQEGGEAKEPEQQEGGEAKEAEQ